MNVVDPARHAPALHHLRGVGRQHPMTDHAYASAAFEEATHEAFALQNRNAGQEGEA